jgi:hypothetical protein
MQHATRLTAAAVAVFVRHVPSVIAMSTRSPIGRLAVAEMNREHDTKSLNEMVRRYRAHNDAASQRLVADTHARAVTLLTEALEILRGHSR